MSIRDGNNPSDYSTGTPIGTVLCEVIDNVDENGTGRILVRPTGDTEGFRDPKECQWIPVMTNYHPQLRGIGISPPHAYEKGSIVVCQWTSQQTLIALGAAPNTKKDDQLGDTHPESRAVEHKHSSPSGQSKTGTRKNESYSVGSEFPDFDQLAASFKLPREFHELIKKARHYKGKFKKGVKQQQTKSTYNYRMKSRNEDVLNSLGIFQFPGDISATEFMEQVGSPPILDSTFDMIKKLKETAQSGQNIVATQAVNGIQNILDALSAASAGRSAVQQQNTNNAIDPFEEFLRQLYRDLTSLEPLDDSGNETALYKLFKQFYLAAMALDLTDEYVLAIETAVAAGRFQTFIQSFDITTLS